VFANAEPVESEQYSGRFNASNVLVVVESGGGFGGRAQIATLDCTGRIVFVGLYWDKTPVEKIVDKQRAIQLVNKLLAMDFLGQPSEFRAAKGKLEEKENGSLGVHRIETIDGGFTRITLHLGDKHHAVALHLPAWGAPAQLHEWRLEFASLVEEVFGQE